MPKRLRISADSAEPPSAVVRDRASAHEKLRILRKHAKKERARLLKLVPRLSSELLVRGLTDAMTKAGSDSVVAALGAAFPPVPVDLATCAVCRATFDKNLNFEPVCESKEHDFGGEYDRGDCPGCEETDAACNYCYRCNTTRCEESRELIDLPKHASEELCYVGVHVAASPSYFRSDRVSSDSDPDDKDSDSSEEDDGDSE